jgi:outer membrane lipoprotein-sorting protein
MHTGRLALALSGAAAIVLASALVATALRPAPAPAQPGLPAVTADELIASIRLASHGPLAGTVELDSRLGLPGLTQSNGGTRTARLWYDDRGRRRIALPDPDGERTIVDDGTTVWFWNSATRSVVRTPSTRPGPLAPGLPAMPAMPELPGLPVLPGLPSMPLLPGAPAMPTMGGLPAIKADPTHTGDGQYRGSAMMGNPVDVASAVLAMLRPDSTVRVDPTAMVADRPTYQLVLDPVPTERTLLREIRVAVDGQTRLPLEVSVLANGSTEPALRIGFSQISFGPQDPALFTFTPAPGVQVVRLPAPPAALTAAGELGPRAPHPPLAGTAVPAAAVREPAPATTAAGARDTVAPAADSALIGRGWDTVLVRRVRSSDTLLASANRRAHTTEAGRSEVDLLQRISSPISGPWGRGRLVSTPIGNAVITTDGRMATGAVPAQVLTEALSGR